MSRIDDSPPSPWLQAKGEKEKLKDEIRMELIQEMQRKRLKRFFVACAVWLVVILILVGLITFAIAKTGLVKIPVFTPLFYHAQTPTKIISLAKNEAENLRNNLEKKIQEQIEAQIKPQGANQKINFKMDFTNKDLTSILRVLPDNDKSPFKNPQVTIRKDAIEIFGEIQSKQKTTLLVDFFPIVEAENNIKIKITKIRLGDLPIPTAIGNALVEKFLSNELKSAQNAISQIGQLDAIALGDGVLSVRATVDAVVVE